METKSEALMENILDKLRVESCQEKYNECVEFIGQLSYMSHRDFGKTENVP